MGRVLKQKLGGFEGMREKMKRRGGRGISCRIGLSNVQELTVAKSVEIRDLIVGGNVEGRNILGLSIFIIIVYL